MLNLRRPAVIITAMVGLLILGSMYRLAAIFNQPAPGTIARNALPTVMADDSSRQSVSSTYASFSHAAFLTDTAVDPPQPPLLEHYNFSKQQFGPWTLAVQVTRLPTGVISDSGTYNYRNTSPQQFAKTERTIGNYAVTIFNDIASPDLNQTAYFQHGDMLASVTVSGGTSLDTSKMHSELEAVIASWQWRQ